MDIVQVFVESGLLRSIGLFLVTFIGALITEMLSLYADTQGVKPFLRKMMPGKSRHWYVVANAILLPIIGTILSFIILEPESVKTSLCAGLTWCGSLQSLGFTIETKKS
ncbi:TPA: hypothetical protein CPT79_00020 [Candidatus Gastranaerophilales bacterium HUM_6]|uniref:hypothetical protein n=1 Tax=Segatella copri TaxID=165179 RepID=UPI000BDC9D51|nr:hypothetical protein [Segatella copri]WOF96323.1 hypothetical protein RJT12_12960 [Segatella copri]DAA94701.1 MAG TPA: hypothetical protein CPT79_00020 [Candidatus Gastranaerophilales bacterium HUM_6]DAA95038.1 MAG TPA: hypothetical protein CPT93_01530 [Candidatus Gastranaerophilales bacterium HUM_7]DAB04818.1 MAG TPA: hypothetical protein CPT78_08570 [Candidatus Gastranaerophilales bacterium HUM_14]